MGSEAKLGEKNTGVRLKACRIGKKGTRFGLGREGEGMKLDEEILEIHGEWILD